MPSKLSQKRECWLRGSAVLLVVVFTLVGCGKPPRVGERIVGTVTVASVPLADGLLTLIPVTGTQGSKASTVITNGEFRFTPEDQVAAGDYRVEIMGMPPGVRAMAEGKPISHTKSDYREIAPEYNTKTKLLCQISHGSENRLSFQVEYEPSRSDR